MFLCLTRNPLNFSVLEIIKYSYAYSSTTVLNKDLTRQAKKFTVEFKGENFVFICIANCNRTILFQ